MSTPIDETALREDLRPFVIEALKWLDVLAIDDALITRVTDIVVPTLTNPSRKVFFPSFKLLEPGEKDYEPSLEDKAAMRTYLMWEVATSFV